MPDPSQLGQAISQVQGQLATPTTGPAKADPRFALPPETFSEPEQGGGENVYDLGTDPQGLMKQGLDGETLRKALLQLGFTHVALNGQVQPILAGPGPTTPPPAPQPGPVGPPEGTNGIS